MRLALILGGETLVSDGDRDEQEADERSGHAGGRDEHIMKTG